MFCKNCGKEIGDNSYSCPFCGASVSGQAGPVQNNTMATVGFVLSFFIAIAGLICSIIGFKRSKQPEYAGNGKSLAVAGIVISSIELAFIIIYIFAIIAVACVAITA